MPQRRCRPPLDYGVILNTFEGNAKLGKGVSCSGPGIYGVVLLVAVRLTRQRPCRPFWP